MLSVDSYDNIPCLSEVLDGNCLGFTFDKNDLKGTVHDGAEILSVESLENGRSLYNLHLKEIDLRYKLLVQNKKIMAITVIGYGHTRSGADSADNSAVEYLIEQWIERVQWSFEGGANTYSGKGYTISYRGDRGRYIKFEIGELPWSRTSCSTIRLSGRSLFFSINGCYFF